MDVRWTQYAETKLRETGSPYADYYHSGLETHFEPIDDDDALDEWQGKWPILGNPRPITVPRDGATDPVNNDGAVDFHPNLISHLGTSWWNYITGQTEGCMVDFDFGHGPKGLDEAGIAKIDEWAQKHPAIMAVTSKGGKGRHWVVFVEPMPAKTRKDHSRNCHAILTHLSRLLGVNLKDYACSHGVIQYIYHRQPAPDGFRLLKSSTAKLKVDPPPPEPEQEREQRPEESRRQWDETHRSMFATMREHGWPVELDEHDGRPMVRLHTCGLLVDYKQNQRAGKYSTNAPGCHRDKPNAFGFARPNGGLDVYRFQDVEESKDWRKTRNGKSWLRYNVPRHVITLGLELDRVVEQSIKALADHPEVYQRGPLVQVAHDPKKPRQCLYDNGAPQLRPIPPATLLVLLSSAARYQSINAKGDATPCLPPDAIVKAVHASTRYDGVPVITGVASCPILRHDGTIAAERGYDPETGLYLDIDGAYPHLMAPAEAIAMLTEVVVDFPFLSDRHRAAWIAELVTLLARHAFAGQAPLFFHDANMSGAGKGLLGDVTSTAYEGRRAARYGVPKDGDEIRKLITTVVLSGVGYLLFDNVKGKFGGPVLENALTTGRWSDRILGGNRQVDLPIHHIWLATGNNAQLTMDMVRRTMHVRLECDCERPDLRTGFRHGDILGYAKQHRRELVMAALSIPAQFIRAGRPDQGLPAWGGYEEWSDLIRNALVWANLPDPDTRDTLAAQADDDTALLRQVMDAWAELGRAAAVGEAYLAAQVGDAPQLQAVLEDLPGNDKRKALGNLLRDYRGRVLDGRKFEHTEGRPAKWQLVGTMEEAKV